MPTVGIFQFLILRYGRLQSNSIVVRKSQGLVSPGSTCSDRVCLDISHHWSNKHQHNICPGKTEYTFRRFIERVVNGGNTCARPIHSLPVRFFILDRCDTNTDRPPTPNDDNTRDSHIYLYHYPTYCNNPERFRAQWSDAGRSLISNVVQPKTLQIYEGRFKKWELFTRNCGMPDPLLSTSPVTEVVQLICSFAAWALACRVWGGTTIIQALSAIRHTFRSNFADFTAFQTPTVTTLRRSLMLGTRLDEARANPQQRLPFSLDMVNTSACAATNTNDIDQIMVSTAVTTASLLLLRIGEYAVTHSSHTLDPDHRLFSRNVTITVPGLRPLTPAALYDMATKTRLPPAVLSVTILVAGSKTDVCHDGTMFVFNSSDFDASDPTNPIAMWTRWALLIRHSDDDAFFSYTSPSTTLIELRDRDVTSELRRVARIHDFEQEDLKRIAPHSVRIGMASHLHNQGVSPLTILQLGRWSAKSSAAPRYQRLSVGACSIVANASITPGHTARHTMQTLTRRTGYDTQYRSNTQQHKQNTSTSTNSSTSSSTSKAQAAAQAAAQATAHITTKNKPAIRSGPRTVTFQTPRVASLDASQWYSQLPNRSTPRDESTSGIRLRTDSTVVTLIHSERTSLSKRDHH